MNKKLITRRLTLYLGLGSLAGIGALTTGKFINNFDENKVLANQNRGFKVTGRKSLKERAARKGLIYGADCGTLNLHSDLKLQKIVVGECAMLVPGFLKWDAIRPTANSFDFTKSDLYVKFAENHQLLLRGHTLVWYLSLPSWFKETVNHQNAQRFLEQHIQQVVGHYAGKMHSWDVVNEAIAVEDGRPDGLRKTPWLDLLGPNYIDLAFRLAAQADPQALLVYNDYGLEYDTPQDEAKRAAVLKLLERLKSQGTPIHAFGMQSHLSGHETKFNPQKLRKFLGDVASLGLKIMITELDAIDEKLPLNIAVRDRIIAGAYEDYLSAALDEKAVIAVITWGLSDRYTWLSEFKPRKDRAAVRPLPFDRNFNRKLAWNAIARAFDRAPKR
jgi:endo-1,4-beta-xylanase